MSNFFACMQTLINRHAKDSKVITSSMALLPFLQFWMLSLLQFLPDRRTFSYRRAWFYSTSSLREWHMRYINATLFMMCAPILPNFCPNSIKIIKISPFCMLQMSIRSSRWTVPSRQRVYLFCPQLEIESKEGHHFLNFSRGRDTNCTYRVLLWGLQAEDMPQIALRSEQVSLE